jgi:hypothetical protein
MLRCGAIRRLKGRERTSPNGRLDPSSSFGHQHHVFAFSFVTACARCIYPRTPGSGSGLRAVQRSQQQGDNVRGEAFTLQRGGA